VIKVSPDATAGEGAVVCHLERDCLPEASTRQYDPYRLGLC
jgi:hypothetical protein